MNKIPVINQIIKDKRKKLKLNQSDFSNLINKSLGTVKRYDTGDIIPENTLILICNKFNLKLNDILTEQKKENIKDNKIFYDEIIKKYDILDKQNDLSDDLDFANGLGEFDDDIQKEFLLEKMGEYCKIISSLYSILYNNFYDDLSQEVFQRWDLKSKKYEAIPDMTNEKIIIKEICTFSNESTERIIDIFRIQNIESILESLKEFFNIKIIATRKLKKRQDKFEDSLTIKKNNFK